ncbi:ribulose-phosphate 3-epimerase [Salibacterium halotolerans]|uniref:Ribulose-phosphate 3-epimerase n=1 Tax=Salibacterium halotolerans TaxID=1884432 RepID=A0A1I5M9B1_9BACI|nr:ribulose-phosphate 3-epimerase [Salibacterium halotolerans]SFP06125.1 ribulose-phosphate 3-epimerase [Salibacterium halotolerans]
MTKVAPSILAADVSRLKVEIEDAEQAGGDYIHVDVMDGHFVPNITMGPFVVSSIRPHTSLPLDVHLMIEKPEHYVEDFARAGADILSVHAEACPHLHRTIEQIHEQNVRAGVVLNPATPLSAIQHVLKNVDLILLMTVNPGFGGQAFIEDVLPKITELKTMLKEAGRDAEIEVDGGVDEHTATLCREAGADVLVAGSAVFKKQNRKTAVEAIRSGS